MKKVLILLVIINYNLLADFIGGEIDIGYMFHKSTGSLTYENQLLSIQDDLRWSLKRENHIFIKGYLEHPLPFLPNLLVGFDTFKYKGVGQSKNEVKFGDIDLFELNKNKNLTSSEYNLESTYAALYYEILDFYINLDLGLMVKKINLEATVTYSVENNVTRGTINKYYPLLYSKFLFEIPLTDISLKAENDILILKNILLLNLDLSIRYQLKFGLGAELGYKINKIKLDTKTDDFNKVDITTTGFYLALIWDF